MSLVDELSKLEDLRRRGALTESEFAAAKQRVLGGELQSSPPTGGVVNLEQHLSQQLDEIKFQNDLAALDREWEIEAKNYMIRGRYGQTYIPKEGHGTAIMIAGGVGGLLCMILFIALTSNAPDFGSFAIAKFIFPASGLFLIVASVAAGKNYEKHARQYLEAFERYQKRRRQLTGTPS